MDELRPNRSFVSYIDRSREYYAAQGYEKPYLWPRYDNVPFATLSRPLKSCRIGLVTTAGQPKPSDPMAAILHRRQLYAEPTEPPPVSRFTDDLFWDKQATHTQDIDSYLPINRLAEFVRAGRIGSVAPRFYGVPTDYSQARTIEQHCPQVLTWCSEDKVDAVILVAL